MTEIEMQEVYLRDAFLQDMRYYSYPVDLSKSVLDHFMDSLDVFDYCLELESKFPGVRFDEQEFMDIPTIDDLYKYVCKKIKETRG
jgi:acyl carrier protein